MRKIILICMETETDESDAFIEHDIKQELSCCSCCFYEDMYIKIFNVEDIVNENKVD